VLAVLRDRRVDKNAREIAAWAVRHFCWPELQEEDVARACVALREWPEAVEVGDAAAGPLLAAVCDPDRGVRRAAVESLGQLGSKAAIDALTSMLVDQKQDVAIRTTAIQQLGKVGGEPVIASLVIALADNDWMVRTSAAAALKELRWTPAREWNAVLFAIAQQRLDDAAGVGTLAIPALIEALRLPAVNVQAARALVRMGPAGVDALIAASNKADTDLAVREIASSALAQAGDARATAPLHGMLEDRDPGVRQSAVWALERLGWQPRTPRERALTAAAHEDWQQLRQLGGEAIEPLLCAVGDSAVTDEVAETLRHILESAAKRMSIEHLQKLVRLGGGAMPGSSRESTAATATQAPRFVRLAQLELIRRGILW
jgi:HEAT repeat protein